jgi:MFS family permease
MTATEPPRLPAPRTGRCTATVHDTFRSLRTRNFRLWFIGQSISLIGFFASMVAQALLVLDLTDNGSLLGLVVALQFAPMLVVGPFAGVLCDRVDKRKLLIATQTAMMLCALLLGALVLTDTVTLAWVFVVALLSGVAWCVDQPTRNAIVAELVGEDDMGNAVSLNAAIGQCSKIIGPLVAAVVVGTAGVGWCFLLNGFSSIAVLAALVMMRPDEMRSSHPVAREPGQIRGGFRYAWSKVEFRFVIVVLSVTALLSQQWNVLLPLLATRDLDGGAGAYGMLIGFMAAGAVGGTLWLARHRAVGVSTVLGGAFGLGFVELLLAMAPSLAVAAVFMVAAGALSMITVNGSAVLLQLGATPEMRGRVMAVFSIIVVGFLALASPLCGSIGERFGARAAFVVGGVGAMAVASAVRVATATRAKTIYEPTAVTLSRPATFID